MKVATMRIGTRLRLGFALVLLLLVIVTALGLGHMAQMQGRVDEIAKVNNVKTQLATAMRDTVFERMIALRNMALIGSMSYLKPEADHIKAQAARYSEAERQLNSMLASRNNASQKEKALLDRIRQHEATAQPWIAKTIDLAFGAENDQIYTLVVEKLLPAQTRWMDALGELIALEEQLNRQAAQEAADEYAHASTLILGMGALAMLMGLAVSLVLTRSLIRQLGGEPAYAAAIAGRIAAGNLTGEIDVRADDRSSLLFTMKSMRDQLAGLVGTVRANANSIGAASGQLTAGNHDLFSGTQEQTASLRETASSIEQLTGKVKGNTENAGRANQFAVTASDIALRGGAVVSQVVDTMGAIHASARRIADIIGVIDGIAFQTNILALNAAVEAARAGEQGRGFAVVASEVRNLAQRSATAAKEIKTLIGDSVDLVDTGSQLVNQAGATMNEVVDSVNRVTGIMAEILTASREQSTGIDQVNHALHQVDQVTRQNAMLVDEAAAAAASMQEQAAELARAVGVFKLDAGEAASARSVPVLPETAPAVALPELKYRAQTASLLAID